jgi:hypothetical protein
MEHEISVFEVGVMSRRPVSVRAAVRRAQGYVSYPYGRGTDWTVIGPYRASDPKGPRTELRRSSYSAALAARTRWVAEIALIALGMDAAGASYAVQDDYALTNARGAEAIVRAALVED